jgi:alcohol dehydrogenase class IV
VESLIQAIVELKAKLDIPPSIREMGVKQEEFEASLRHMAETVLTIKRSTPTPATR